MADSTYDIVKKVLVDGLGVSDGEITMEADINDDLGADSLDAVELIMSLEDECGIEIDPAQAQAIKTVGDLVTLVDSLK
jgi:acyl carrier protein